jgi:hypothetical protein
MRSKEEDMRRSLFGALLIAGLVIAATAGRSSTEPAFGGTADVGIPSTLVGDGLIAQVTSADGLPLTVTVIDPGQRVMGVYHVDRETGEIALRSVRNLTWDLQMIEFNSGKPLPQDVRGGLQR